MIDDGDVQVVDTRERWEWAEGHVPGRDQHPAHGDAPARCGSGARQAGPLRLRDRPRSAVAAEFAASQSASMTSTTSRAASWRGSRPATPSRRRGSASSRGGRRLPPRVPRTAPVCEPDKGLARWGFLDPCAVPYSDFLVSILRDTPCLFVGFSFTDPAIMAVLDEFERRIKPNLPRLHLAILPDISQRLRERLHSYNFELITYESTVGHESLWESIREAASKLSNIGCTARALGATGACPS